MTDSYLAQIQDAMTELNDFHFESRMKYSASHAQDHLSVEKHGDDVIITLNADKMALTTPSYAEPTVQTLAKQLRASGIEGVETQGVKLVITVADEHDSVLKIRKVWRKSVIETAIDSMHTTPEPDKLLSHIEGYVAAHFEKAEAALVMREIMDQGGARSPQQGLD